MELIYTVIIGIAAFVSAISTIVTNLNKAKDSSKTTIDKYIDDKITSAVGDKLDSIGDTLATMQKDNAEEEAQRLRYECLNFAADLRLGLPKTKLQYEEIFRMEDKYDTYIEKYNIKNNLMNEEMTFVHEMYRGLDKK